MFVAPSTSKPHPIPPTITETERERERGEARPLSKERDERASSTSYDLGQQDDWPCKSLNSGRVYNDVLTADGRVGEQTA